MNTETVQQLSIIFKAVADVNRQQILHMLHKQNELSAGAIARSLSISQPATSQHLRVLREAKIIQSRKAGQQVYYTLCSRRLYRAIRNVVKIYQKES